MSDIRQARIDDLKRKLRARGGNPAYKQNVIAIQDEINRLEAASSAKPKRVRK